MSIYSRKFIFLDVILVASVLGFAPKASAYYYYNDNPQSYYSGNCHPGLSNLGDNWGNVRSTLNNMGWGGVHYVGQNSWGSDFIESTLGGHDDAEADSHNVAIFDGHGNVNCLGYAYQDPFGFCDAGYCGDTGGSNIAMGMQGGGVDALLILDTCCYMMKGSTISIATFGGVQELGFGSLSSDDSGAVNNFFGHTSGGTNWYYWLHDLEDRPGWFTGDNTTVVVTRGWNNTDVSNNRTNCKFKGQTCLNNPGYGNGPTIAWQRDYINHGCGGCAVCN